MKTVHIMEALAECIEKKILDEWKHEGFIDGMESGRVYFEIDGQKYVVSIEERRSEEEILEKYGKKGREA